MVNIIKQEINMEESLELKIISIRNLIKIMSISNSNNSKDYYTIEKDDFER